MTLIIPNSNKTEANKLIEFFIKKIQSYVESNLNKSELSRWDSYLKEAKLNWGIMGKKQIIPSTRDIILGAVYNLTYNNFTSHYVIEIDDNIKVPNTNITYSYLVNLINYGNLSINGYNIINKAYLDIINNFLVYVDEFKESN